MDGIDPFILLIDFFFFFFFFLRNPVRIPILFRGMDEKLNRRMEL